MPQSLHRHTPSLTAYDPRGLTIRAVAYHRRTAVDEPQARIHRQVYTATGLLSEQWDPRLTALRASAANQRNRYSLSGRLLHTDSVDRGVRIVFSGAGAELRHSWDARGTRHTYQYDSLLRVSALFEQAAGDDTARCVERLSYADNSPEHARHNRCARLLRHDDPAGTLWSEDFDLQGRVTSESRRFVHEVSASADWPLPPDQRDLALEPAVWRSQWRYDALGQLLEQTDAKHNRQRSRYAVDGLLTSRRVLLNNGTQHTVLQHRTYNASGNIKTERAGNGVLTALTYDPKDERLLRLKSYRSGKPDEALQDLSYGYDHAGNVLSIDDVAQPVQWSDNTRVQALSTFTYDTLYQLIEASGRENAANGSGARPTGLVSFGAVNDQRPRQYRQSYAYDAGGNLIRLQHMPSRGSGYTRHINVSAQSNHSLERNAGQIAHPGLGSGFDPNGNLQMLEPGQTLTWNLRNQLQRVAQVTRENGADDDEIYAYDSSGARALKITSAQGLRKPRLREVYYLPGLEIRRNSATGEALNLLKVEGDLNSATLLQWEQGRPEGLDNEQVRFSLSDHLGSSTLELDQKARLLSQESYYPYGGTAWWAAKNALEASYKFVRYSGKERDASGLYYYGYRYYSPWLARWISADPADDIDGLNLYAMTRANPISRVEGQGLQSTDSVTRSGRLGILHSVVTDVSNRVTPRVQASSAAAIRDALATFISNAVGAGVDIALFEGRQPSAGLNTALRSTVAALDALAVMHMGTGLFGHVTRWSPFIGFFAATAANRGFEVRGASEGAGTEDVWDPVARIRLAGHVRAFTREVVQQLVRGLGESVSWGQTPVSARIPRTLAAAGAYSLATVPNAVFGQYVPGPLVPNVGPLIEAYDAAAGTAIRAGHATARLDRHVSTLQVPGAMDTVHGGLSRMFNQTWTYWAGVGIEAVAQWVTGQPVETQSGRARAWVGAAKGVVSAFTEIRGALLQTARSGFGSLFKRWRTVSS